MKIWFVILLFGVTNTLYSQKLPIRPSRTIAFTTDEGTNMSVDVSPDGQTLLFDLLGDLYSVPIGGGSTTQLTRGMAINRQPVWSPDGKKIAYLSDYSGSLHLNVRDISGKFHVVLGSSGEQLRNYNNAWPIWTPDGSFIAAQDKIYSLTGSVSTSPIGISNILRFSANGQSIFYFDSATIFRYDRSKNIKTKLCPILNAFESGTLSPDAHWWAYVTDSGSKKCLVIQDLINNASRILVPSLVLKYCLYEWPLNAHYSFSPDSKNLFIGYGGKIHRIDVARGINRVIPFAAKVKVDLGPLNYNTFHVIEDSMKVKYTRSANTSPDGKYLVFAALGQLYIMDLPNGKPRLLASQPFNQYQPVWSPDGKWIAYVSWCDTVGGFLWRISALGGQPEKLTRISGLYQWPAWAPDGTLVAVTKGVPELIGMDDPRNGQLQVIPVNGGPARVIDDTVPLWNQITFSAVGDRIIYEPRRTEGEDNLVPMLVSKNLKGNDLRIIAVARTEGNPTFIRERTISPDGRFVVYSLGEDLYLVPVCGSLTPSIIYDSKHTLSAIKFSRGVDPFWENGSKMLNWSYGNNFFKINPDKILAAAKEKKVFATEDNGIINVTIKPDQVISLNLTVPDCFSHGQLALENLRIITMQGDKIIEHGTILIKNGRFVAVGPTGTVNIPRGTKILDLNGTTVMPGLVDLHLHMHQQDNIFPQQSWMYLINLAYGVTTARDPRTNVDAFGYMELLETGRMIGPRLYPSGRSITSFSGGMDDIPRFENLNDARNIVHKRSLLGGTLIKQYGLPTRLQRQWLLIASREEKMNITNEGDFGPQVDLGMFKDGNTGVEHNPIWGDVYRDMTSFISQTGTYFTPTLQVHKGYGEDLLNYFNYLYWNTPSAKLKRFMPDAKIKQILDATQVSTSDSCFVYPSIIDAQIRKQGGYVTLGSHGNNEGIGVHNELWALQMGGISNMEALQAATIMGAEAIGIQKDVGSIEIGKIADLIILNKNPLEDIHNSREIRYVMKGGILYDGDTLDEIWPVVKRCPDWKFKGDPLSNTRQ